MPEASRGLGSAGSWGRSSTPKDFTGPEDPYTTRRHFMWLSWGPALGPTALRGCFTLSGCGVLGKFSRECPISAYSGFGFRPLSSFRYSSILDCSSTFCLPNHRHVISSQWYTLRVSPNLYHRYSHSFGTRGFTSRLREQHLKNWKNRL